MRPLLYFDLETTGVDVSKDRIVDLAILPETDNPLPPLSWRFNPGLPISPEATEVHGITDEMVANCPPFAIQAEALHGFFSGVDLAGYNLAQFDVPLLWEEFHRAGIDWDLTGVHIIDACRIYRQKEPRTLEAAVRYYLGEVHGDAHGAGADVVMTRRVLERQRLLYEDLAPMDRAALAAFCGTDRNVDIAGKIVRNDEGVPCYAFGTNKGVPVIKNRSYAEWMMRSEFPTHTKQVLRKILFGNGGAR